MPDQTVKPRIFVGSSIESLDVAYAIQENLEFEAEVTVWTQGVFELSRTTIQMLMQAVDASDFAIFVFAPDDVVKMREEEFKVARDNVVFELGLFAGGLGEDRAFIILPRGSELHLPTDLAGMTPATYDPNRRDHNLVAALGPACTRIKRAIEQSGLRQTNISEGNALPTPVASGLAEELRSEVGEMLKEQEKLIQSAFETFEKRVAAMIATQRETDKAPYARLSRIIETEISGDARRLLTIVANSWHLTREQYDGLEGEYGAALEELRGHNLLVVVTGYNEKRERIPVYWLNPKTKGPIKSILADLPKDNSEEEKKLRQILTQLKYPLP